MMVVRLTPHCFLLGIIESLDLSVGVVEWDESGSLIRLSCFRAM